MTPGIYENLPFADYLEIDAFSSSMIGPILRSPKHLEQFLKDGIDSDQVTMGALVDCLVLEEEKYPQYFQTTPEIYTNAKGEKKPWDLRSSTCRTMKRQIEDTGRRVITQNDLSVANQIKEEIYRHTSARELLVNCQSQISMVWEDVDTGILCKGRIDVLNEDSLADLKTTHDGSPGGFSRHLNKYHYHCQASFYVAGWAALNAGEMLPFHFIVAETAPPYCVATYIIGEDSLMAGDYICKQALKRYQDYKESDTVLGYSEFIEPVDIPVWASAKILEQGDLNGI